MTRFVYLLAASHSGSTLLAMLLGAHSEVCSVGELKWTSMGDIGRYRCSCGTLILECPFWQGVGNALARRGFDFDMTNPRTDIRSEANAYERRLLEPLHRGPGLERLRDAALSLSPGWRHRLRNHQVRNRALAEAVLKCAGKKVIVDSSKIGVRLKHLLKTPGLDIKVIRVVRDGRAVALTYTNEAAFADANNPALRGGGFGHVDGRPQVVMADAATQWRRSNEEASTLLSTLDPGRWTEVRYEDLCRDPRRTLERVCGFIGVRPDGITLDFRSREHHVVGNGMRLDASSDIRLDERWKAVLNDGDLGAFARVAGPLNRRLGYA